MFVLPASVTVEDASAVRKSLAEALRQEGGPALVVDGSELKRFDSSALAVLLAAERLAGAAGKRFSVQGLPPQLASLATLYGVEGLLSLEKVAATASR